MAAVAAAAMLVGTGIQVYGDIKSANDQASLDDARARIADQQGQEIAGRELANEALRNQQAYRQKLQFGSAYAASGKAGTGVGSQLQIQNQADLQNLVSNREAQFQEKMLAEQSGIDTTLAEQTRAAGTLNAIGAGISGIGKAAGAASSGGATAGAGGTQGLGAYPSAGNYTDANFKMPKLGAGAYGGG